MSLTQKAAHGMAWVTLSTIITKLLGFTINIVLAKILVPADFGLLAIGMIAINTMGIFRDLGFGAALIYKKDDPNNTAANTAFILLPVVATILFAIAYLSAPYIAVFFGNTATVPLIQVLAMTFIISSFGIVPSMLLEKELEFKKKVLPDTVPQIGYAVVAIGFALNGYGVWSLIYGQIVSAILTAGLIWIVTDWRPNFRLNKKIAVEMFGYSKHILGANIMIFLITNVDNAIVGKILGIEALGYYTFAYAIANLPATQVTQLVARVMFPVYSKLQDDKDALKSAYLKMLKYVSMLSIPAAFGIFVIAPDFIKVVMGEKWMPAVPALQVLCFFGLFRSLNGIIGPIFQATGNVKILQNVAALNLILFSILVLPLIQKFGIIGVSVAAMLPQIIIFYIMVKMVNKILNISLYDSFKNIQVFLYSTIIATIISILLLDNYFKTASSISLIISFVFFSSIFLIITYILDKNAVIDFKYLINLIKNH